MHNFSLGIAAITKASGKLKFDKWKQSVESLKETKKRGSAIKAFLYSGILDEI